MRPRGLPSWWPWPVVLLLVVVLLVLVLGEDEEADGRGSEAETRNARPEVVRRWPVAAYPAARSPARIGVLRRRVASAIAGRVRPHATRIGVYVGGVAAGEDLYGHRAGESFIPASNGKLLAMGAALLQVGPDHVFVTRLMASGTVSDGLLEGDLILVGSGDPGLSPREHDGPASAPAVTLARAVADAGIRRVAGQLLLDDGLFDRELRHPTWKTGERMYRHQAEVTALVLNDGCIHVMARPGPAVGAPARVTWDPVCDLVKVDSAVRTLDRAGRISAQRPATGNRLVVRGGVRVGGDGQTGDFTLHDPTRVFGSVVERALETLGVSLAGGIAHAPGAGGREGLREIGRLESPVATALIAAGTHSNNLAAECLLKLAGARFEGEGSWAAGERAVVSALREAGIETDGLRVADGSGLSRENRVTPRQLGEWLRYVLATPGGRPFRVALASGREGTLRKSRRFREDAIRDRVRLKTGWIAGVRTLSGYVETERWGTLVVSILSRDAPRDTLDGIVRALIALDGP